MPRPRRVLPLVCPEQPPEPFSAGSLTVRQACVEFGGFTRQRLFELMHAGKIEWSRPEWAKGRILCRASLQAYLKLHRGKCKPVGV